jgi:NAD(P)-dependent dehydrogenase (short-subunit alcohol dehydrogenase family)
MKQILLTGGAGGLGRAAAEYFADRGCRVFSCDLREQREYPGIIPIKTDLRDSKSVEAAREKVEAATGRLDAVISLAGVYMMDSLAEISEDRFDAIMDVNLKGTYLLNKTFLPLLKEGRIIVTTSELAGRKPLPFTGIYAISKTALECYADSLRLELQMLGIRVITVRPGAFRTQLLPESSREMAQFRKNTRLYKENLGRIERIMEGQFGKAKAPETLAKVFWRAAMSKHPRIRYTVNGSFLLRLYSAMPRRLQAFALRLLMKKDSEN